MKEQFRPGGKIGRNLLILIILAILLAGLLIWMSIELFDPNGSLDLDDFGIFAFEIKGLKRFIL